MDSRQPRRAAFRSWLAFDEERVNTLTHLLGLVLSCLGLGCMLVLGLTRGTVWHLIGFGVFGCSLILLYGASSLYHSASHPQWKATLRIADHVCIFFLIAGTYTPLVLPLLSSPWHWLLFALVWATAILGIVFKIRSPHRFHTLADLSYVGVGGLTMLAVVPCSEFIPQSGISWFISGGMCYLVGNIFYYADRLPYFHAIWHLFVLAGSSCHFWAVMSCVPA